jgi:hypothetical protein
MSHQARSPLFFVSLHWSVHNGALEVMRQAETSGQDSIIQMQPNSKRYYWQKVQCLLNQTCSDLKTHANRIRIVCIGVMPDSYAVLLPSTRAAHGL